MRVVAESGPFIWSRPDLAYWTVAAGGVWRTKTSVGATGLQVYLIRRGLAARVAGPCEDGTYVIYVGSDA